MAAAASLSTLMGCVCGVRSGKWDGERVSHDNAKRITNVRTAVGRIQVGHSVEKV